MFLSETGARLAFRTSAPVSFLSKVATTKAFIFWLEALAQILSLAAVAGFLSGDVVCFVDNSASEHALRKGYSKDARLTNLLGWFWAWVASKELNVFFVRVSSKANLSDAASRGDWEPSDRIGCHRCQPELATPVRAGRKVCRTPRGPVREAGRPGSSATGRPVSRA